MGGAYLAMGNSDNFVAEFNFFKDPWGAACLFDNFKDITLLPLETTNDQRKVHSDTIKRPFTQTHTDKGRLVHDSFRLAFKNFKNHYETCDPLAVGIAFSPDTIVTEVIEKYCFVETEGELTKGAVVVDWFERYPAQKGRSRVKIVTKINNEILFDLMTKSVLE
jgi:inosine-uridine nucleoside N-ribohydrolase